MTKFFTGFLCSTLSLGCLATEFPAVGLLEQIPVMGADYKVIARPIYIFTNKKLTSPTVFTGMAGTEQPYIPVCCYQVRNISPLDLPREVKKYHQDEEFGSHMRGIRGYAYLYAAEPLREKSKWTSMMSALIKKSSNPDDGSPFSAPVLAGMITAETSPLKMGTPPNQTTLHTRYDKKSDRLIFTFQQGKEKIEFSEPTFAH